jgi:hypothetical protein
MVMLDSHKKDNHMPNKMHIHYLCKYKREACAVSRDHCGAFLDNCDSVALVVLVVPAVHTRGEVR